MSFPEMTALIAKRIFIIKSVNRGDIGDHVSIVAQEFIFSYCAELFESYIGTVI